MTFPSHLLRPRDGQIWGLVFENRRAGVPLGLYWSVEIQFSPVEYEGETLRCLLSAGWLTIPVRDWRELAGRSVSGGPEQVEASFYTLEHDLAIESTIRVGARDGVMFEVDWDSVIALAEGAPGDAPTRLPVRAVAAVPFTGVLVHSELLEDSSAETLVARFLDRGSLGALTARTNRFGVVEHRFLPE